MSAGLRRYHANRRKLLRVLPADLAAAGRAGTIRPELRPLVGVAGDELSGWLEALGGAANVSPQRRSLLESAARLGIAERMLTLALLQGGDPELASRLGTVSGARGRLLSAAGLDEQREQRDLSTYLEERAREAEDAAQERRNGARPAEPPTDAEIVAESAPSAPEESIQ